MPGLPYLGRTEILLHLLPHFQQIVVVRLGGQPVQHFPRLLKRLFPRLQDWTVSPANVALRLIVPGAESDEPLAILSGGRHDDNSIFPKKAESIIRLFHALPLRSAPAQPAASWRFAPLCARPTQCAASCPVIRDPRSL